MGTRYRIGPAVLDAALARVERGGASVELQPKPLAVLLHLLAHRDRVVSREELFRAVWPGVAVTDSSLTRAVSVLRATLGESASDARVIRTHARRGYRLVAPVHALEERPAAEPRDPFVGRAEPLAALLRAWDAARSGAGGVALVSGEAGIGKTRVADELAARVRADGGRALVGYCPSSESAPPFWPWARALRGLAEGEGPGALEAVAKAAHVDLADLLPERAPRPTVPRVGDSAPAGFTVLDALDRLLGALAAQQPLLVVLDDLHWADRSSLRALEHVARGVGRTRLLLVGTYRHDELGAGHPLHETLAGLARAPTHLQLRLEPLDDEASDRLVSALASDAAPPEVAHAIRARSAGNPLFLRELVRAWLQEGAPPVTGAPLPPGIRELLGARIAGLPAPLRGVLQAAAVVGSEVGLELLREIAPVEGAALSDALESATRGGWLRLLSRGPTRYGFTHPLVHEALRAAAPSPERVALHARAAAALAARHGDRLEAVQEELAEHHLEMARGGHRDARPALHARRAAELAERRLAFDDAVRWLERALDALELHPGPDEALRGEILASLARNRWTVGDRDGARAPAEAAAALARRTGDGELLARAALVFWVRGAAPRDRHPNALALLEEAARALPASAVALRAEVLARTAEHLWLDPTAAERTIALCDEALRLARAAGSAETLYTALYCTLFSIWPHLARARRRALSNELAALADGLADPSARIQASALHLTCLLEAGAVAAVDAEIARFEEEIARFAVPSFFRWYGPLYRAMRATMAGRLAEGERLALESYGHAQRAHVYDAQRALAAQMFQLRSDQGRLHELEAPVADMAKRYPNDLSYVPLHAFVLAENDRPEEARTIFERFVDGYEPGHDGNRDVTGTILASVCAALGDAERAARLYAHMAREAEHVTVNLSAWLCQGSLHWPLGKLAATRGDASAAERHFSEAARRNEEIGARTFLARTWLDHAALCAETGARGEARELARAARAAAEEMGMARVAAQARDLARRLAR